MGSSRQELGEFFLLGEFDCRDGTEVPETFAKQLPGLVTKYLSPLRAEFGPVHILSGFRTLRHNAQVGGARASFHLAVPGRRGVAADVVCRSGTPRDWHRFLDRLDPGGLGRYPTFVHVDTRQGTARW